MSIKLYTRKVPAGITGTTIEPERKPMNKKIEKKSKYPKPVTAIVINFDLATFKKRTKDELLTDVQNHIAGANDLAIKLADATNTINKLKVDLKIAKADVKSITTAQTPVAVATYGAK